MDNPLAEFLLPKNIVEWRVNLKTMQPNLEAKEQSNHKSFIVIITGTNLKLTSSQENLNYTIGLFTNSFD